MRKFGLVGLFGSGEISPTGHRIHDYLFSKLDTSGCYMGQERFNMLLKMLEPDVVVLGIDEMTGCVFDFEKEKFWFWEKAE